MAAVGPNNGGLSDNYRRRGASGSLRTRYNVSAALLAMAGHDLRQPLQVIIGAHDVLARSIHERAERAQLRLIADAVKRLAETLEQLVQSVRLQELPMGDHHEAVSMRPIFAELVSEFTGLAELRRVKLRVIPASAVVSSHPVLLLGILRNLVRNAILYTPSGGRVLVACRRRGSDAHIEIRDSGVGISAAEMTKIFRPFHRAGTTCPDGLGLGLFIVSRAARFLGHRVEVRSAVGRGSCFVVVAKRPFG